MPKAKFRTSTGESAAEIAATVGLLYRYVAAWLDKIFAGVFAYLFYVLCAVFVEIRTLSVEASVGLCTGGYVFYFFLTEATTGRTIGKALMGLVVVDVTGQLCSWRQSLIRNLLRPVDVNPFFIGGLVPGGLLIFVSHARQRVGDLCAGTFVIESSSIRKVVLPDYVSSLARTGEDLSGV